MAVYEYQWIKGEDVQVFITTEDTTNGITTNSAGAIIVAADTSFETKYQQIPKLGSTPDNDCLIDSVTAIEKSNKVTMETIPMDNQDTPVPVKGPRRWSVKLTRVREGDDNFWLRLYEQGSHGVDSGTTLHNGKKQLTIESGYRLYLREGVEQTTSYFQGVITDYDCEMNAKNTQREILTFEGADWSSSRVVTARTKVA